MHKLIKKTMSILAALGLTLGILAAPLTAETVQADSILGPGDDGIYTIAIDAGHGGTDPGAVSDAKYGLHESDLNLTIARYLVDYLNQYRGIRAFLTRTDDTYWGLTNRVTYAVKQNADIFISIHNNASGTNKKASFSMVYVPNNNYRKNLATEGTGVAKSILSELEALGRQNNGTQSVNSSGSAKYPDGSTKDYYAVIREAKEQGIPGIIVEHAFITTEADVKAWFLSDNNLKQLAEADGRGIIKYYNLTKEATEGLLQGVKVNGVDATLTISSYGEAASYDVYRGPDEKHMELVKTFSKDATLDPIKYTDKGLKMDSDYSYYVVARLASGNTLVSQIYNVDTTVSADTLKLYSSETGKITLEWDAINGVEGYRIFRSETKNGTPTKIKTIKSAGTTTYTDTVASLNKSYYYYIDAYQKIDGKLVTSEPSTLRRSYTVEAPTISNVKQYASGTMQVNWPAVAGANGYNVYRSANGSAYELIGSTTTNKYNDRTCEIGKTTGYKVEATIIIGENEGHSSLSNEVQVVKVAEPSIERVATNNKYNTVIEWETSLGASGYELYRADGKDSTAYKLIATIKSADTFKYLDKTTVRGGIYSYKIRALNNSGKATGCTDFVEKRHHSSIPGTTISSLVAQPANGGVKLTWKKNTYVDGYIIYRSNNATDELTKVKVVNKNTTTSWVDKSATQGTVNYSIRTYTTTSAYGTARAPYSEVKSIELTKSAEPAPTPAPEVIETPNLSTVTEGYLICGPSNVTVEQMVKYYISRGVTFPTEIYATSGAATIDEFAQIVYEEATVEGVKPEVVFAQVMKETGLIQFPNCDVNPNQCNFAGIGATGNGEPGNVFPDVRTGIRAQVQHLKAYGSTEPLVNECVDPRFHLVTRGNAIYVEWLGINENPNHTGWAGDPGYGISLVNDYIAAIMK